MPSKVFTIGILILSGRGSQRITVENGDSLCPVSCSSYWVLSSSRALYNASSSFPAEWLLSMNFILALQFLCVAFRWSQRSSRGAGHLIFPILSSTFVRRLLLERNELYAQGEFFLLNVSHRQHVVLKCLRGMSYILHACYRHCEQVFGTYYHHAWEKWESRARRHPAPVSTSRDVRLSHLNYAGMSQYATTEVVESPVLSSGQHVAG